MNDTNMKQIFEDFKNDKNNVCNSIYNNINTIIDTNSFDDSIHKLEEYIECELKELKDLNDEINLNELFNDFEDLFTYIIDIDVFGYLGISKIINEIILQFLDFIKNKSILNTYKKEIRDFIKNNDLFLGFNRYLLYDCDDNFERMTLKTISELLYVATWFITNEQSTIISGVLLVFINKLNEKIQNLFKKKELEFIKFYFLKDFKKIQKNIIQKINKNNNIKNYDLINKKYYKGELTLWKNYNNTLYLFIILSSILLEIHIIHRVYIRRT
jgi:hypothetical protein